MLESLVKIDNTLVWHSGMRPFYEVYYFKITDPNSTWSFWARYTLCTASKEHPSGVASVWAIFTDISGTQIAARQDFDLLTLDIHHSDRFIQIGDSFLSLAETSGQIESTTGNFKWELMFEDPVHSLRLLPALFYHLPLPKTKFVEPRLLGHASGTIFVNDRKISLDRAKIHQAHIYGSAYANDWAWANCIDFSNDPSAALEILSARVPLGKKISPALTLACVRFNDTTYRATSPLHLFTNKSRHDFTSWDLHFRSGFRRFHVEITRSPDLIAAVTYHGPNNETRYCYNTNLADVTINIEHFGLRGWQHEATLKATKKCAFETVRSELIPEHKKDFLL